MISSKDVGGKLYYGIEKLGEAAQETEMAVPLAVEAETGPENTRTWQAQLIQAE